MTEHIKVHKGSIAWRDDELRPEWLGDGIFEVRFPQHSGGLHTCSDVGWDEACALYLPRTHWAAPAIEGGWRPWAGGDAAPDDWDGGEVLLRCGETFRKPGRWGHLSSDFDVVGYKPKPPVSQVSPELDALNAVLTVCDEAYRKYGVEFDEDDVSTLRMARALMAEREPPVDPLDQLLRYHETGGHEGDGSDANLRAAREQYARLTISKEG